METAVAALLIAGIVLAGALVITLGAVLVRTLRSQVSERDRLINRLEQQVDALQQRIQYLHAQGFREAPPETEEPETETLGLPPLDQDVQAELDAIDDPEARAEYEELIRYHLTQDPDADPRQILREVFA